MTSIRPCLFLLGALLLACGSEPREPALPRMGQALPNLPLPPNPEFVSRSGSADALQITLRSSADPEQVAEFYRGVLSRGNWRLISDIKNRDGSTTMYAEQNGPPLWVRIWKTTNHAGTMVQLTGAVSPKDSIPRRS